MFSWNWSNFNHFKNIKFYWNWSVSWNNQVNFDIPRGIMTLQIYYAMPQPMPQIERRLHQGITLPQPMPQIFTSCFVIIHGMNKWIVSIDVRDLLLTFHEDPILLTKATSHAMLCDNHLFEQCSGRQLMSQLRIHQTYVSVMALTPLEHYPNLTNGSCIWPKSNGDQHNMSSRAFIWSWEGRPTNYLCLYCGGAWHMVITCPHKPKQEVNQVNLVRNLILIP